MEGRIGRIDESAQVIGEQMNVAEYFQAKFEAEPRDGTLADLPIESPCGQQCKAAIDAGQALLTHIHAAIGTETIESAWVIEATDVVCQVYWRG